MSVQTDSSGRVIGVAYHDALLTRVELVSATAVELEIQRGDGSRLQVSLCGVKRFALTDFLEGNIVDTMYAWGAEDVPENVFRAAANAFHLRESDLKKVSDTSPCEWFLLESSYGASVYALVEGVELSESEDHV